MALPLGRMTRDALDTTSRIVSPERHLRAGSGNHSRMSWSLEFDDMVDMSELSARLAFLGRSLTCMSHTGCIVWPIRTTDDASKRRRVRDYMTGDGRTELARHVDSARDAL